MIAHQPAPALQPRLIAKRSSTRAAQSRKRRATAARYTGMARVLLVLLVAVVPIIGYVMLTANLTGLNYAVAHSAHERVKLEEETLRLDDRIAYLRSRERLDAIARKLGMREPHQYAVVALPVPVLAPKAGGVAFLDWFKTP